MPSSDQPRALVAYGPLSAGQWKLEAVVPREIKDNEVLVNIVASGVCLADVHFGDVPENPSSDNKAIWYPRVLGHEGSGIVEKVGRTVKGIKPGDQVLLSYMSCGKCYNCEESHPAYCINAFSCNFEGERGIYTLSDRDDCTIGGAFFGQSSFASQAIAKERCLVNLQGLDLSPEEMQILAPLGCGIQTGCGAFLNIADVQPTQTVAVLGVGGVGQSAIMAAVLRGCKTIIAIDRNAARLELSKTLGATHTIDTSDPSVDLVSEVLSITGGTGVHISLDTTGQQKLAKQSWEFVRFHGKILQVGLANPEDKWDISMVDHMNSGKQIIGCVQGDAIPQKFAVELIKWYRQGKLPIEKIVTRYPVEQFKQALQDMREGTAIKPVLVWEKSRTTRI